MQKCDKMKWGENMKNEMWLIWKHSESRRRYKIGVLSETNSKYIFKYVDPELNDATSVGFRYFPGFEDIKKVYESDELFANIETRLPNPGRADYLEILNSYNLEKYSDKMEILKATKGRLVTDNYEFVPAFDSNKVEFDVAGTRYCSDVKECSDLINVNDKLSPHCFNLLYSSSVTGSSHSLEVPSPAGSNVMWLNQLFFFAPCQCLTFAGITTTLPASIETASFPHS